MEKAALKGMFANGKIPVGTEYKAALTDILQTFPYFQLAQVFYAKQMYDTNEPDASGRIKLASVYAPDRKAMYLLFKTAPQHTQVEKPLNDNKDKANTAVPDDKAKVKYNYVYTSSTAKDTGTIPTPTKGAEKPPVVTAKEVLPTETFVKKELEAKLPVTAIPVKPIQPDEAKNIEAKQELNKTESPVVEKKPGKLISSNKIEALPIVEESKPGIVNKEQETKNIINEAGPAEILPNEPMADSSLKYSFSSWLKVIPEISLEKKEAPKPSTQKDATILIDTFLKKMPSISRPKAEFFSSVKAAKMSITEDDTIISETLANIYFTQGNLPKALKAYQSLLLQFPEKNNIFAARIEEIKTLIRENTKNRN